MAKKNKGGRPTVMTPEVVAKLEEAFMYAFSDAEACLYANISKNALYDYCQRNPEFTNRKELLKKKPNIKAKLNILKGINSGDIDDSKWWLERKSKEEFSLRKENTGADGGSLSILITDDIDGSEPQE